MSRDRAKKINDLIFDSDQAMYQNPLPPRKLQLTEDDKELVDDYIEAGVPVEAKERRAVMFVFSRKPGFNGKVGIQRANRGGGSMTLKPLGDPEPKWRTLKNEERFVHHERAESIHPRNKQVWRLRYRPHSEVENERMIKFVTK